MNSQQPIVADPKQVWENHVRKAVLKFLKTAVVVDNDPREKVNVNAAAAIQAVPVEFESSGLGDDAYIIEPPDTFSAPDGDQNILDIRKISDSFSEQGMACAFVLPEDSDPDET